MDAGGGSVVAKITAKHLAVAEFRNLSFSHTRIPEHVILSQSDKYIFIYSMGSRSASWVRHWCDSRWDQKLIR
jgi:hypothetical protein